MYRIEKRIANSDTWGLVAMADTRAEAVRKAREVEGGKSTGVRVVDPDSPDPNVEIVVGY